MTDVSNRLALLGDSLEAAIASDLARARRPHRRLALAALAATIAVPGAGIAAERLISDDEVAKTLPAGILALAGMHPTCTTVTPNVEYRCVLDREPARRWGLVKGSLYPTVDASGHVNGGCRALNDTATEWQCYIGQAAVDEKIIGPRFLGEPAGPGVG